MSICPKEDIFSLYIDNELPEPYRSEFEAHLKDCSECSEKLRKAKAVSSIFKADRNSFDFSEKDLDQSFERLQARLSYKKITGKTPAPRKGLTSAIAGVVAGVAAAVAVISFVPSRAAGTVTSSADFQPIATTSLSAPVTQVSYNSSITPETLSQMFPAQTASSSAENYGSMSVMPSENQNYYSFASYDIFSLIPSILQAYTQAAAGGETCSFSTIPSGQNIYGKEISNSDFLFNVDSAYNYTNYMTGN